MAAEVSQEVVKVGRRRVATSPGARPGLRLLQVRPKRRGFAGRPVAVASCNVSRVPRVSAWVAVRVALVAALTVAGGAVSVARITADMAPDPARQYVAGDPAWAHVTQP